MCGTKQKTNKRTFIGSLFLLPEGAPCELKRHTSPFGLFILGVFNGMD